MTLTVKLKLKAFILKLLYSFQNLDFVSCSGTDLDDGTSSSKRTTNMDLVQNFPGGHCPRIFLRQFRKSNASFQSFLIKSNR